MDASRPGREKGKRTALWVLALGLALLPAVCLALRERLLVEWCLRRITLADVGTALDAVERLARIRSARAAEGLFMGLEHDALNVRIVSAEGLGRASAASRSVALDRMGERARSVVRGLCEALKNARSAEARIAAAEALTRFACDDEAVRIALIGTAENDREELCARVAALEALCAGIDPELIAPTLAALVEEPGPLGEMAARILRE